MIYIYVLRCPETGAIRYVGKTKDLRARLNAHISKARSCHTDNHCANWIRSVLGVGALPLIESIQEIDPGGDWQSAEAEAIITLRELGCDLTNSTGGGDGFHDMPQDILKKRGESRSRSLREPEARARFTAIMAESHRTPEARENHRLGAKAAWADEQRRTAIVAGMRSPSGVANRSAAATKAHADPAARRAIGERSAAAWKDPDRLDRARLAMLAAWDDPDVAAKMRAAQEVARQDPEVRERFLTANAEKNRRPDMRVARSEQLRAFWDDPVASAERRSKFRSPETRAKMSASAKARWADPEKAAAARAVKSNPETRAKQSAAAMRRATPEYRAMMAARTKAAWEKRRQKPKAQEG